MCVYIYTSLPDSLLPVTILLVAVGRLSSLPLARFFLAEEAPVFFFFLCREREREREREIVCVCMYVCVCVCV
jgi:hypothetical protein